MEGKGKQKLEEEEVEGKGRKGNRWQGKEVKGERKWKEEKNRRKRNVIQGERRCGRKRETESGGGGRG